MKIDFWIALMTRLICLIQKIWIESDSEPNWIGSNRTERIESDRLDWIGNKNLNDSDLNRIVLPMLGGNILRLQIVEIKSEQMAKKLRWQNKLEAENWIFWINLLVAQKAYFMSRKKIDWNLTRKFKVG